MRVIPGGSQYLSTGSLGLSNVPLAPNGGLAAFSFSRAEGVIGSWSGLAPVGSDGSQLVACPPVIIQMPDKHRGSVPVWLFFAFAGLDCAGVCAVRFKTQENRIPGIVEIMIALIR